MRPSGPVRGHDGDEINFCLVIYRSGIGLQDSTRVGDCDRYRRRPFSYLGIGAVARIDEGCRHHKGGQDDDEKQLTEKEAPGDAPTLHASLAFCYRKFSGCDGLSL